MAVAAKDDKTWVELIAEMEGYIFGVSTRTVFYTALTIPLYLLFSSDWPAYVAGLLVGWHTAIQFFTWTRDLDAAKYWASLITLLIGVGFSFCAIFVTAIMNMDKIRMGLKSALG